ncbi:MAG: exodeoxyribonuclease VII small subunit [Eubacteriales bacterium]|nr:exodeoxyribonuclease VII small subunit [Eubacteriales bacterium]
MNNETNNKVDDLTLDQLFGKLDEVLSSMEEENSLEKSFGYYHEGMDLLKACNQKIEKIEKQILILDQEGETHEF